MDTIQLQCGNCKNVMAISFEHLGQQVQCPHCQAVLQTEAAQPDSAAPAALPDRDLTQPENTFGGPQPAPVPEPQPAPFGAADAASTTSAPPPENDFTQFKPRPRLDKSVFLLIALIFLVPYAFTITLFLAFLLSRGKDETDELKYIRDPMPAQNKGGPRKVQAPHDSPIVAQRKTNLGQAVKAGDLEVTPKRVVLTNEGDLQIYLYAKNISANTAFEPMHDSYVNEGKSKIPPYTFLETRSKDVARIYGFNLAYHKNPQANDAPSGFAVLGPRDAITIVLVTESRYRPTVAAIAKATDGDYTWRMQVRRGFVKVDRKDVSATTVIGVDFSSKDIERDK